MVERDLAKVDVAGSTPVSRSRFWLRSFPAEGLFSPGTATVFSRGAVPKW